MATVFDYAVLIAIPDPRRGERVNVGIVVFAPGGLDVRLTEMGKVKALTGNDWSSYATTAARRLKERFASIDEARIAMANAEPFDAVLRATSPAWFAVDSIGDYEGRVKDILASLVVRPKRTGEKEKTTRINTEIARELKQHQILADGDDTMDSHKVFKNVYIEDELRADFAQRNGVMRVAATLDLRRPNVNIREATLKAIVLDRAKRIYGNDARRIGVYAASPEELPHCKQHLELLHDYSDEVYNWEVADDRLGFMEFVKSGFPRLSAALVPA